MKPELFKVGPEYMEFMGTTTPIIEKTMAIISAHNAAVSDIAERFTATIEEAWRKAVAEYEKLCADTSTKLRG